MVEMHGLCYDLAFGLLVHIGGDDVLINARRVTSALVNKVLVANGQNLSGRAVLANVQPNCADTGINIHLEAIGAIDFDEALVLPLENEETCHRVLAFLLRLVEEFDMNEGIDRTTPGLSVVHAFIVGLYR